MGNGARIDSLKQGGDSAGRLGAGLLVLLALAAFGAGATPASAANYEPNDSPSTAAGPLLGSQGYAAGLETSTDADYYFFYVTSPEAAKVSLTVEDMGGGSSGAEMDVAVTDSLGTPIAGATYLRQGETRSLTAELKPQKYFLQVTSAVGFGDSYRITTGADGFGPYSVIAGRCGSARAASRAAGTALRRAKLKRQRAVGRLRRARYGSPHARAAARAAYRRARSRVRAARRTQRAATAREQPWCSIPQ